MVRGTMLLRFRRLSLNSFLLIATGVLAFDSWPIAFAQQVSSPPTKPNSLRFRNPQGEDAPPLMAEANLGSDENEVVDEDEGENTLVIGSADTQLASGSDSEAPIFMGGGERILGTQDLDIDLSIGLEMATASLAHVSPFFWWMSGPTSDLFRVPAPPTQRSLLVVQDEPEEDADNAQPVDQDAEPPLMLADATRDLSHSQSTPEDVSQQVNEAPSAQFAEANPQKTAKKPTPRTVRMPFEQKPIDEPDSDQSVSAKSVVPPKLSAEHRKSDVVQRDPDSQHEQEEPKLDPSRRVVDRELQGVDAIHASKPGAHRREIKIEDPTGSKAVPPIVPKVALEPALARRLQRTAACLDYYLENPESTSVRSPWAVMHALIAFGGDYELVHGSARVNAIGWMCHNGTCRTQRMFTPKGSGFTPNVGGGVQGHEGQFLAILAQSNVPLDYPIQIGNAKFTVEDLVRYEMATCKEKSELTFKLIGLSYYLDSNKQWRANDGKTWNIPKLIQEELSQPIVGSACGGTHRLMGFSFSVRQRQLQGLPINGQYARAAKFVKDYIAYTWQLQNPDGSFSTNWYEGRGNEPNEDRKVQTSGHMLEWLMFTLPDEDLKQPRVAKGIDFLLSKIYDQRDQKWPIGPRGHATRAIALYQARMAEINSTHSEPIKSNAAAKSSAAPIRK
jgi:hypothetical protein